MNRSKQLAALCLPLVLLGMPAACKSSDSAPPSSTGGTAGASPVDTGGAAGSTTAPDTTVREYPATDERIRFMGRMELTSSGEQRTSAPGAYAQARFRGSAVTVLLEDQYRNGNNNYFDVIIDERPPIKLTPERRVYEYPIELDLEYGEHVITVVKRTEASVGWVDFRGFRFAGEILDHGLDTDRRIEIIGDSISAGSGNEGETTAQCSEDYGQPYSNASLSYGALAARAVDADYHITAVSGIGLIQNYDTRWDARTLPEVYDLLYVEDTDSPEWDHSLYTPDAVVIALGTNDFSTGDPNDPANEPPTGGGGAGGGGGVGGAPTDDSSWHRPTPTPDEYAAAYVELIDRLRDYHGDELHVFCMHSPMLGNSWPNADDSFRDDHIAAIGLVVSHYADAGDDRVHEVPIEQISGTGCGTHPDTAQHSSMADQLLEVLRPAMGWD